MDNLPTIPGLLTGVSNRFAFAAMQAVAHHPSMFYNPLWVYGPSGTGKSTLLHTALRQMQEHHPELRIRFIEAEEYIQKYLAALQTNTQAEFRARFFDTDVLALDHAEYFLGKTFTQLTLARELARLADLGHQVILVSTCPATDLEELHQYLPRNCEWYLQADIQTPTDGERMAMVRQIARELDLQLSEPMAHRIVQATRTYCHVHSILNHLSARLKLLGPDAVDLSKVLDTLLKQEVPA